MVDIKGDIDLVSVGSLKKGNSVVIDNAACRVTKINVSRPGKHGHAKVNLTAVGLLDEKKRNIIMPGHDKIAVPIIDNRTAQVLNVEGDSANVMDIESYETFQLKIPDELKDEISEGGKIMYSIILDQKVMKSVKE